MGQRAKRKFQVRANDSHNIRYGLLSLAAITITAGIGLCFNDRISAMPVAWGLTMPPFVIVVGAIIGISVLFQTVRYDTSDRRVPERKIGTEFGEDDAEITDDT
jgi:hypothetical protein